MTSILNTKETEKFILDGFVRIDHAFSKAIANAALDILWNDLPVDRLNPLTWTEPVIRLGMYSQQPFVDSVNSDRLHQIFDQLVGAGRWFPCRSVGTFPVRFPSPEAPNDTGKHVDASFPGADPANFFEWRVNVKSKGRALLMLVLYSDVSELGAPAIIDKGSHMDVAKLLYKEGDGGLSFMELAAKSETLPHRGEVHATGKAGTIYLCHPFLVHAAQPHRGLFPRFMAQPPLLLRNELTITDSKEPYSPVEAAIRLGLKGENLG